MQRRRFNTKRNFRQFPQKNSAQTKRDLMASVYAAQQAKVTNYSRSEEHYIPENTFMDFPLSQQLLNNIKFKGYNELTPIQDKTILPIIEGKDVIGIANTGTGKTAAFLIPLVQKVIDNNSEKIIVVTPTRELAVQIYEELRSFGRGLNIYAALCVGGTNMQRQTSSLRQNPNFVIGTPGRLKDHIESHNLSLSRFHTVVLDEADRMVDIGFIRDIKFFISLLPQQRQSLFFSATVSGKVKEIIQSFVRNPVTISVKRQEAAVNVEQEIVKIDQSNRKVDTLHDLLIKDGFDKVLVFGRTKWGVQKLTEELLKRGFKAGAIHGNKNQNQRQRTLDLFKQNELQILVATDVASRGLDIQNVSHVINYDIPESYDDYVHRIGRTGRADKKGTAITFIENN